MAGCWAAPIGGCVGKLSGEHLVSEGLWDGPTVSVVGLPWCKDVPKDIGLGSLTSKVLCRAHNSALSPADAAGITAFDHLRVAARLGTERSKAPLAGWDIVQLEADGQLLERWFLKTAINLCLVQPTPNTWELSGDHLHTPPVGLIQAALGHQPLQRPLGLYVGAAVGDGIAFQEGVEFWPITAGDGRVVGFAFMFFGIRVLLWTSGRPVPDPLVLPNAAGTWAQGTMYYHLVEINFKVGVRDSHVLRFRW